MDICALCLQGHPFQEKVTNRVPDRGLSPHCMSDLDAQHDLTRPPTRTPPCSYETRIDHTLPLKDMCTADYQLHTVQITPGHKYNHYYSSTVRRARPQLLFDSSARSII